MKLISNLDILLGMPFLVHGEQRAIVEACRGYAVVMPPKELATLATYYHYPKEEPT